MNLKQNCKIFALTAIALLCVTTTAVGQKRPSDKSIIGAMNRANDYFMDKWPDTKKGIDYPSRKIVYESNIWTRAVYYEGVMALYDINKDKRCLDYAVDWGKKWNWGLRRGVTTRHADNQCCGQTYIMLHNIDPQPERIADIKTSIDAMMATDKIDDWSWIDAIQMAMPIFIQFGVMTGDEAYYERAYQMYAYAKNKHGESGLFNPADGLWWRDKAFDPPYKEPNGEDCYWSRGNGWVIAALVRVLEFLPQNKPHRAEYEQMIQIMSKALLPLQREDGFWNVSLHDSTHFGGPEATGTALFVYGMAWGINNGVLDAKTYRPVVLKAWNALESKSLHKSGFLGYVQGTGKEPKDGQPVTYTSMPDFEDYGLGCFLLAGSQVYKMK